MVGKIGDRKRMRWENGDKNGDVNVQQQQRCLLSKTVRIPMYRRKEKDGVINDYRQYCLLKLKYNNRKLTIGILQGRQTVRK